MIPILTPKQMSSADAYAIDRLRIPSLHLMERAGIAVTIEVIRHVSRIQKKRVLVLCGKGNNGGDGFVVVRLLHEYGVETSAVLLDDEQELRNDARENFNRLEKKCVARFSDVRRETGSSPDVIIDALFGTSFAGALEGKYLSAIRWCNERNGVKIAVDIPSGMNGTTGEVLTDAFRADMTVTISHPKSGFYFGNARDFTGEVIVADIGLPGRAIERHSGGLFLTEPADIRRLIPVRPANSHKHSVGKVFIVAGSKGMMGAALLCAESAMRSGAGQVILGIPDSEYPVIAKRTREVMPLGLPSTANGSISTAAAAVIAEKVKWSDVVIMGCGLSRDRETMNLVRTLVRRIAKPMVIDADGLFALSGHLSVIKRKRTRQIIMTPHFGEFSRLSGIPANAIEREKFTLAKTFAKKYGVTLALKGAPTLIASSSGQVFVNPTGNPGMSTAGSGDVLAGIIGAMVCQGLSAEAAAVAGVYLHGRSGDLAAQSKGMHGMIASDMIRAIPEAFLTEMA